jgi:hypothetical protein
MERRVGSAKAEKTVSSISVTTFNQLVNCLHAGMVLSSAR